MMILPISGGGAPSNSWRNYRAIVRAVKKTGADTVRPDDPVHGLPTWGFTVGEWRVFFMDNSTMFARVNGSNAALILTPWRLRRALRKRGQELVPRRIPADEAVRRLSAIKAAQP